MMGLETFLRHSRWMKADASPPRRKLASLDTEVTVHASLAETFAFFSDAANLERLTPPWLNFQIRTRVPIQMHEGLEIDYRIVLHGVRIPWRSRIDVWEPGVRFVDRQIIGPYRWWRHEHSFEAVPSGTRVVDRVEFLPRVPWLTGAWVRRDVDRIFTYRLETLAALFERSAAPLR